MNDNIRQVARGIRVRGDIIQIRYWYKGREFSETLPDVLADDAGIEKAKQIRDKKIQAVNRGLDPAMVSWPDGDVEDMSGAYSRMFIAARKRKKDYMLTAEQERTLVSLSKGQCALTGIPFSTERGDHSKAPFAPSLDRIDSRGPYTIGNVRIVCVAANFAMNEWGEGVLEKVARGYVQVVDKVHPPVTHRSQANG